MNQVPLRIVTREKQQLAELERKFEEVARQQEELTGLIRRKRTRLADINGYLDD